jgi:hypothetical protein
MELKQSEPKAAFMPRTMGVLVLVIITFSFTAGAVRRELVLTLTGAVFLAIWVYCLVMTLLLALLHRRHASKISIRLNPEKTVLGEWIQVAFSELKETAEKERVFQFPCILVRCHVLLITRDGRRVSCVFKPEIIQRFPQQETFQVKKRGAWFSAYDEFAIFDALGFFRFAYRIPVEAGVRLLVSPYTAGETVPVRARGGQSDRQAISVFERTDNLIEHRPYVPGDDTRRINWKLYGHGGGLFIREGEREPPPHSSLVILIDTQYDALYTAKSVRNAVDLLCENALAVATDGDRDVQIGFTRTELAGGGGQTVQSGNSLTKTEAGFFLALPYAIPITQAAASRKWKSKNADLPPVDRDLDILILAMPRLYAEASALDRFLSKNANRIIDLVFIYGADANQNNTEYARRAAAAETCVSLYNKRPGVRARAIGCQ